MGTVKSVLSRSQIILAAFSVCLLAAWVHGLQGGYPYTQAPYIAPNSNSPLGVELNGVSYFTPEQPFLNVLKTDPFWVTANNSSVAVTISVASPGVVTCAGCNIANGAQIRLGGTVPTGLSVGPTYFAVGSGSTFNLATSYNGTAINTSGSAGSPTIQVVDTNQESILQVDSNGYPKSLVTGIGAVPLTTGTTVGQLVLGSSVSPFYPGGNDSWIFKYTSASGTVDANTATFAFAFDCTKDAGASTLGRIVLNVSTSSAGCRITVSNIDALASGNYPNSMALIPAAYETLYNSGEQFNPAFIAMLKPFKSVRFMDWMNTISNSTNAAGVKQPTQGPNYWSVRTPQTYFGYGGAYTSVDGVTITGHSDGVPVEVMIALCNELGADAWFNMPIYASDADVASFANLVLINLNASLKAYAEVGNELWNGASPLLVYNYEACGESQWPTFSNPYQAGTSFYSFRASRVADIWSGVWAGANASRFIPVITSQAANAANGAAILQGQLWASSVADTSGCTGSSVAIAPPASAHVKALGIAPYFGYDVPVAWTASADGGLTQLFAEMISGGQLPVAAGAPTTGGTSTAYTLTSGQSLPATPANGTTIALKMNATNGAAATLTVDSGNTYPINVSPTAAEDAGALVSGSTQAVSFTNATSSGAATPSWIVTTIGYPGGMVKQATDWVPGNLTVATGAGIDLLSYEGGQTLISSRDENHGDEPQLTTLYSQANLDPRMGLATANLLAGWRTNGGHHFQYFADVYVNKKFGNWGMFQNVNQTFSAKYNAVVNWINVNQCWWTGAPC